jgi:hypothetical protein
MMHTRGDGWIETAINTLATGSWAPEIDSSPKVHYVFRWPAALEGFVWILLRPAPERVDQPHKVKISWGRWRREVIITLPTAGIALRTEKAVDPVEFGCHVSCSPALFLLFGAGNPRDAPMLDISLGWKLSLRER